MRAQERKGEGRGQDRKGEGGGRRGRRRVRGQERKGERRGHTVPLQPHMCQLKHESE